MLDQTRKDVLDYIGSPFGDNPGEWTVLTNLVGKWFDEFKNFEGKDTFTKALNSGRLMARVIKSGGLTGVTSDICNDCDLLPPLLASTVSIPVDTDGRLDPSSRNNLQKPVYKTKDSGSYTKEEKEWINTNENRVLMSKRFVGIDNRMKPSNFAKTAGKNLKNSKGLHAQCYSLISNKLKTDETLSLKKQIYRQDPDTAEDIASVRHLPQHLIFYFGPLPEDNRLIALLIDIAKHNSFGHVEYQSYKNLIEDIKTKMTRIKFASDGDIGTKPLVSKTPGKISVKIIPDPSKYDATVFRNTAISNYTSILRQSPSSHNEMIVCIRHHENNKLPICIRWDNSKNEWPVVDFNVLKTRQYGKNITPTDIEFVGADKVYMEKLTGATIDDELNYCT